MSKRISGTPRHPRSPVAKAVRTPAFKMRVVPDKRWPNKMKDAAMDNAVSDQPEDKGNPGEPDQN